MTDIPSPTSEELASWPLRLDHNELSTLGAVQRHLVARDGLSAFTDEIVSVALRAGRRNAPIGPTRLYDELSDALDRHLGPHWRAAESGEREQ